MFADKAHQQIKRVQKIGLNRDSVVVAFAVFPPQKRINFKIRNDVPNRDIAPEKHHRRKRKSLLPARKIPAVKTRQAEKLVVGKLAPRMIRT